MFASDDVSFSSLLQKKALAPESWPRKTWVCSARLKPALMGRGRRPPEPVENSQVKKKVKTPITNESLYVFSRTYTIAIRYFV